MYFANKYQPDQWVSPTDALIAEPARKVLQNNDISGGRVFGPIFEQVNLVQGHRTLQSVVAKQILLPRRVREYVVYNHRGWRASQDQSSRSQYGTIRGCPWYWEMCKMFANTGSTAQCRRFSCVFDVDPTRQSLKLVIGRIYKALARCIVNNPETKGWVNVRRKNFGAGDKVRKYCCRNKEN